ncbi:MAG: T9SS type A sorting domain-containing protein, partial [Bacteroidetes bacterium]|nr:T9SS type A sorting domain-containing protein [Bacteroidota bacterium]
HIKLLESLQDNSMLSITDISGRTLRNETLKKGTVTIDLNVDELPEGRYFIRIYNSSQVINESFVIVK